jgi:plasmid maintenance system antidote protein VapI
MLIVYAEVDMTKKEGRLLRKKLKARGIQITQLAKAWGVTRQTIHGVLANSVTSRVIEEKLRKLGGLND